MCLPPEPETERDLNQKRITDGHYNLSANIEDQAVKHALAPGGVAWMGTTVGFRLILMELA